MSDLTSTGRRRELGASLRHLRESRDVNGIEMAARMRWTSTMLSRTESGKRVMTEIDVATYTGLCGVAGEEQEELLALAREPEDYRIKPHVGQLPDELRTLMFFESTACVIEDYEPIFIPGLIQTEDYARAIFYEHGHNDATVVEAGVRNRMSRHDVLTRYQPAQCTFLVHENALRMTVGGPQVMLEQLLHILFICDRPQCSIRVIPTSTGARGMAPGAFQIFGYPDDPPVVYLDHQTTAEFLENGRDLLAYRSLLNRLATVALDEAQSRSMIAWAASELERGAAHGGAGGFPVLAQE